MDINMIPARSRREIEKDKTLKRFEVYSEVITSRFSDSRGGRPQKIEAWKWFWTLNKALDFYEEEHERVAAYTEDEGWYAVELNTKTRNIAYSEPYS